MASSSPPVHPIRYLLLFLVLLIGAYSLVLFTGNKEVKPKLGIDLQGGTRVTLTAEYTGGDGSLVGPFEAPFPSGATLDAGIVSSTTTFTLRVIGPAGDALDHGLVVVAR